MHEYMKTITLDEPAYALLKAWKKGGHESFSSVVKRVVPAPGTLGSFLRFVESHQTDKLTGNDKLEKAIHSRSVAKPNPWI